MKILGITAEYNPLHNGHIYQIEEAKKITDADCCIVAMSGNFTQRGMPAIADKWIRARQVVEVAGITGTGADLVVELPFAFACNTARYFAAGGIDTLVRMGADYISFGCEAEDSNLLNELALNLIAERETIEKKTLEAMKDGFSRAKAHQFAVEEQLGREWAELMLQPNNILAIEYYKRIAYWKEIGKKIEAVPVVRKGSSYDGVEDIDSDSGFAGASQIRKMIAEKKNVSGFVPSLIHFEKADDIEYRLFLMLKAIIVRSRPEDLKEIYGVGEGLHHKMKLEINDSYSMEEYLSRLVSKRYTEAAMRRVLTYVLLGIRGEDVDRVIQSGVDFARILAVSSKGRSIIKDIKANGFNVITNINKEKPTGIAVQRSLDMDIQAADVYNMLCGKDMYAFSDRVFRPFIED